MNYERLRQKLVKLRLEQIADIPSSTKTPEQLQTVYKNDPSFSTRMDREVAEIMALVMSEVKDKVDWS